MIWVLYCEDEIDKAQQIMSYAEPLGGMLQTLYARAEAIQAIVEGDMVSFVLSCLALIFVTESPWPPIMP